MKPTDETTSFMLLGFARCLCKYLFCFQKSYAGNACFVIFKSTLLKLSTIHIPVTRAAWLKVTFVSAVKSLSVSMYRKGPILMLWPSKALSSLSWQAILQVILLQSRGALFYRILSHYHQGCYYTWLLGIFLIWELFQVAIPGQWLCSPMDIAFELSSW